MIERTSQESSSVITPNKTHAGVIFWIAEMTVVAFTDGPSVWFEADVSSVEVELSDET